MTDCLYVFIYHIWRFRRKLSLSNLSNSFPDKSAQELEQIARQAYRNACNMIAEVLKGAVIGEQELRQRVRILNIDALARFTQAGQSVIMLASHHCNWEWLLLASCLELKIGVDAVYKPLRVAAINRFILGMRSRFGGNPIPVKDFLSAVLKRRGAARVLALVADQTPPWDEEKHWTRFLNQDTAFFVGADKHRAHHAFAGIFRGYAARAPRLLRSAAAIARRAAVFRGRPRYHRALRANGGSSYRAASRRLAMDVPQMEV